MLLEIIEYSKLELYKLIEKCLDRKQSYLNKLDDKADEAYNYKMYETYLLPRIKLITDQCKYFIFEENYTEHAWKEIYALHYVNTNYPTLNKVMRIHFFKEDISEGEDTGKLIDNYYLGYITLRQILDYNLMLSFVVPNWKLLRYKEQSYIMTYKKIVHIGEHVAEIDTFAFFSQDSVLTTCAHADIFMLSIFTNNLYNHKRLKICEMFESTKYNPLPNQGLACKEILDIFYNNNIPVNFHLKEKEFTDQEIQEKCIKVLETYIESRLPIIVYNENHVVLVIGHTNNRTNRKYIIYDDSGAFLHDKNNEIGFIGSVSGEDLFPSNNELTYFVAATHERVYMNANEFFGFLEERTKMLTLTYINSRSLIADNTKVKEYLAAFSLGKEDAENQKALRDFINIDLPHYVWYSEIEIGQYILILIADPTFPVTTEQNIFYGLFYADKDKPLGLLTKIL